MDHLWPPSLVSRTYSRTQGLQVGLRGSHSAVIVLRFVLQLPTPVAQPQLGLGCGKRRTVRHSRHEAVIVQVDLNHDGQNESIFVMRNKRGNQVRRLDWKSLSRRASLVGVRVPGLRFAADLPLNRSRPRWVAPVVPGQVWGALAVPSHPMKQHRLA
jgi:hypothetical protein